MRIAPTQQEFYPDDIGGLIKKFGDELICSICLNIYEDPVLTPCNHAFCRECVERAVTLTKKGSTVPVNQCPVCKAKTTKRSLNPSSRLYALAQGYESLAREYSRIIGDENWMYNSGLKGSESYYTGGGQPLENLSQLFPYPEKPRAVEVPDTVPERCSSPLLPNEDFTLGFNTLAALDQIELPSTPDILKHDRFGSESRAVVEEKEKEFEVDSFKENQTDNIPKQSLQQKRSPQQKKSKQSLETNQSPKSKQSPAFEQSVSEQTPKSKQSAKPEQSASSTKETSQPPSMTPVSKIKIKTKTIKVEAMSTPAKESNPTHSLIVSTSGLKADSLIQLTKWSDQFKVSVLPELPGSNLLILATDAKFIVTKRTMKYFEALLQPEKYTLVSSLWIDSCLKSRKLVPHLPFTVKGDQVSIKRGRGSKSGSVKTLFANHRFYLYGTFNQPPPDQLVNLIHLTGSSTVAAVEELPTVAKSYKCMVLVDASNQVDYERDAEIIRRFPILSATWILDCFSCQKVLDYKEYLLL